MATNGISETRTSINCENIPELFLDKLTAKMHFSQFGKIKRFILRPSRLACTVEYEQPEAAQQALERGGQYKNMSFIISWTDVKPQSFGDNGKIGGPSIDMEVQMELEAIDNTRGAPSPNLLAFYKSGEQRPAVVTNSRPSLPKPALPPAARTQQDPKIKQARVELETLARKPAFSAEERYRVLEAKDRYIRLTTERTTDIRKAKNIVGTCPDMCPEKERYLREWKCMVPSYEKQAGGATQIDHVKAIKQYSRSSADQELPLPHELRSQQALGRTMHFLLINLADLCDDDESDGGGNVSDWFHYIWDRTRGIRKDITQQDLCSPTVVELVEQCTRFHIHCAARLVSEDPSVFDQKINTENMTKCLQTLKYMYTDLAKRGQRCPAEAEFRAYMVLLYLNDGNFLWELRQLPEAIIHSREIQFALSVYFALEENNFVRFFQLVQSTSYMNACILLRYFTQVRQKALEILRKAYAVRSTATFSLEYMTNILGFEDEEEADAFFDHYGIVVDQTTDMVIFEPRQLNFYKPDLPFPTSRAVRLVESKRTVSTGEAICGRPLEQWEKQFPAIQRPTESFDTNGCLKEQVLEKVFADRKENAEESLTQPQKTTLKDLLPLHPIEEDKVDSTILNARDETMSDDRIFKVPSPTIAIPRLSPRARTPPSKPTAAPFVVEQNVPTPSAAIGMFDSKAPSAESSIFQASTAVAPKAFTFPTGFGNNVFGSVTPPSNPSTTTSGVDGSKLFGSFGSSTSTTGSNIFNQSTSNATITNKPNTFGQLSSIPMQQYISPPTNISITPAGQTFFEAAKETSLMKPQTPAASASLFQPKLSGFSPSTTFGGEPLSGSVNPFARVNIFDQASAMPNKTPSSSSPALVGGFFQQSLKEKNDFKDTVAATPKRPDPNELAELEEQQEKLKQEQERKRQEQLEKERKQSIERAIAAELEKLLDLAVQEIVPEIADTALERHKRLQQYPLELFNELADETLATLVLSVAKQELDRMERIKAARAWKLSVKYFHRWHRHAQSAARWRRLMRTVPPSFINGSVGIDQLPRCDQLRPFLNARFAGTKLSPDQVLQDEVVRREVFLFDAFPERQLIDPFMPLEGMIHQLQTLSPTHLLGLAGPICWKMVVSIPTEGEEGSAGFPSFVQRWLQCCGFRKDNSATKHPYFYLATKPPPSKQRHTINSGFCDVSKEQRAICMRLLRGQSLISEKDTDRAEACNLSDAVIFFLSDRCCIEDARKRLNNILAKCGTVEPSIAVILYCPNNAGAGGSTISVDSLEQKLGLAVGTIKRWRVFPWCKATENDTLREAINYLTNCYRAHLQFDSPRYLERLEMRPLTDFLEICVGPEMWFRLDKACRKPDGCTLAGRNGNAMVQLYNSIVSKVQSMVNQDLKPFVRVPEEFGKFRDCSVVTKTGKFLPLPEVYFPSDWHSSQRKDQLIQLLKSLELRPLPNSLQNAIDHVAQEATAHGVATDVTTLRAELNEYLSTYRILSLEDTHALSTLTQQLVQGIVSQLAGCVYESETQPSGWTVENVRHCYWVPLLALISEKVLRTLLLRTESSDSRTRTLPLEVCYRRSEFLHHTESNWWKGQLVQLQEQALRAMEESQSNISLSNQSSRSNLSTITCDRKRTHKEISQYNDSIASLCDSFTSYSDSSFSDSIRSDTGCKRTKIVNGVRYSQEIVDDVIAEGMKALARAEQMLTQQHRIRSELQTAFKPLEQNIQEVEKSCRILQYQHGRSSPK
uniref:Germinal-center associated nuclear protein n=1 Tax=Anopheles funestus TaxID=62324 RepID=A0A182RFJ5_ANOFN